MYELIHANCIDVLRHMPDKSVDCIVTDPPYVISTAGCGLARDRQYFKNISNTRLDTGFDPAILDHLLRVARRPNLVIFASRLQLRDYLNWAHEHDLCWSLISWHKTNPLPLTNSAYLPDTEYVFHFTRGKRPGGNYHSKRQFYVQPVGKSQYAHPTVKPLNIVKNLVLNAATARGQLVLDPFMGSGTTGVAAIQLGQRFIGIEMNGDYLAIAKRRIAQASPDLQPSLKLEAKDIVNEST
jgi:site-specific DNA-methyltransferase (adenine-specific)